MKSNMPLSSYEFNTAQQAFEMLYLLIMQHGNEKSGTKYIKNVSISILDPQENLINTSWRKWNHDYAKLEWAWYKTGDRNPDMVAHKAPLWNTMRDENGLVFSNYGYWWKRNDQYDKMIKMLSENLMTRRAILVHYSPDEVDDFSKDTPCNVVLNFHIDPDSKLNLTVFARSIDLVYGFCNDQYCFSKFLLAVSKKMGPLPIGTLHYFITDLHIYERHYEMRNNYYNN
jgi:thymidylate synthase